MNSVVEKQLLINSLPIPAVLQDIIKDHIFIDKIAVRARQNKGNVLCCIKRFDYECEEDDFHGHVSISYRYEFQFQSIFCLECGGYQMISKMENYINVSQKALCSCPGFHDVYLSNVQIINAPIQIYM